MTIYQNRTIRRKNLGDLQLENSTVHFNGHRVDIIVHTYNTNGIDWGQFDYELNVNMDWHQVFHYVENDILEESISKMVDDIIKFVEQEMPTDYDYISQKCDEICQNGKLVDEIVKEMTME